MYTDDSGNATSPVSHWDHNKIKAAAVTKLSIPSEIRYNLIARMVCTIQKEECFNGLCDDCPMEKITDILTHNNVIDLDDECSWTLWKKVNNKFDLQQMIGSIDSLLTEIEEKWSAFLLHTYCTRQQRDHIKQLRSQ
jgi:hypothetical protein